MPSPYRRLSLEDAVNLIFESADASMEVGAFMYLEAAPLLDAGGRLRLAELQRFVQQRLPGAPELLRRILFPGPAAGRPVWVDDAGFDIRRHVLVEAVLEPGTEAEALGAVSQLMRQRLSLAHPPWQIWFLTGISGGRVGMLIKHHHVLADGTATVNLTRCLLDLTRLPARPGYLPWRPGPPTGYMELLLDNLAGKARALARAMAALRHPGRLVQALAASLHQLRVTLQASRGAPRLSINRALEGERRFRVARYQLEAVREVAHAHGPRSTTSSSIWRRKESASS